LGWIHAAYLAGINGACLALVLGSLYQGAPVLEEMTSLTFNVFHQVIDGIVTFVPNVGSGFTELAGALGILHLISERGCQFGEAMDLHPT
jgi:hypothetical protein